ncbi:hypothetical protein ACHMW6_23470 [Pseudoduganella sp. UC29_106]|uniref:hypothetical protein n=1 Tax=Pseudoduganella sp. UC29_106 TaxID=3374553 RepID=UPI0037566A8A
MLRALPLLACGLLAAGAYAQQQNTPERVLVPATRADAPPYFIFPDDLDNYKGEYFLSNGKRMYISRLDKRLFAQVGRQREHEIRPVAEHKFEAVDGSMSLHIEISRRGHVSGTISYLDEEAPSRTVASLNVP